MEIQLARIRACFSRLSESATEAALSCFMEAAANPALWSKAKADPQRFFKSRNASLPEDVGVVLEDRSSLDPMASKPAHIMGWRCLTYTQKLDEGGMRLCTSICVPAFKARDAARL